VAHLAGTELPEGARHRLDARLAGVLEEVLADDRPAAVPVATTGVASDAPTTIEATGIVPDQLATRRRWRALPALTGVAAGLVLLAGGVIGLGQTGLLSGGDDQLATDGAEADMSTEAAREPAPEDGLAADALAAPVVIDEGRTTAAADLDELLTSPDLQALAGRLLPAEEGELLAVRLQQQLLGEVAGAELGAAPELDDGVAAEEQAEDEEQAGSPEADTDEAASVDAVIVTRDAQVLSPEDAAAVRRCLIELLEAGTQAIPTTIELLEVDGVPAIAYGLVTLDPETGAFTRTEVWTLERANCQVVRFAQS